MSPTVNVVPAHRVDQVAGAGSLEVGRSGASRMACSALVSAALHGAACSFTVDEAISPAQQS